MAISNSSIQLSGFEQVYKALEALPAKIQKKALREGVKKAGEFLRDRIAERAPYRTGLLRDSIVAGSARTKKLSVAISIGPAATNRPKASGDKRQEQSLGGETSGDKKPKDAYYAKFIEFGTVNMAARPFMRPVLDANSEAITSIIEQSIREFVERGAK